MSGTLRGETFALGSATYLIDRRPGHERVDIVLSMGTAARPCGPVAPRDAASVWLRRWGATRVDPEQIRIQRDAASPWEAHYQVREQDGWRGSGDASALIVLSGRTPDGRLEGELSVCFADGAKSCVKGTFTATYCPISIDAPIRGVHGMESPASSAAPAGAPPPSAAPPPHAGDVSIEPRSHLIPTYPCSQCHAALEVNRQRRKLTAFHVTRNAELDHGDRSLWCYQCHSSENLDKLVIANGALVTFDEADRLCGSCHGDKGRDWRAGIHGLTQGAWRGKKVRKLCTHCHNPHNPWFASLAPEAPPARPHGEPAHSPTPHPPDDGEAQHGK